MFEYLTQIAGSGVYGYLAIIVVLILTGSGLPVPEEVPVIVAGILSADGTLNVWLAFASCLVGALAGDCLMYFIGYQFGISVLREHPWFARHISPQREARAEKMLQEHGLKVFFLARFLVALRSPMFLTAGILRVPFRRFIFVDAISATVVIGIFFGLSFAFAERILIWWDWIRGAEVALTVTVVVVALAVATYYYIRHRRRPAAGDNDSDKSDDTPSDTVKRNAAETESAA